MLPTNPAICPLHLSRNHILSSACPTGINTRNLRRTRADAQGVIAVVKVCSRRTYRSDVRAGGLEHFPFFTVRKVDAPNERGFVEARICCCSAGIVVGEQAWRECNVRVGSMITVWCGAKMVEWERMEMFYSIEFRSVRF